MTQCPRPSLLKWYLACPVGPTCLHEAAFARIRSPQGRFTTFVVSHSLCPESTLRHVVPCEKSSDVVTVATACLSDTKRDEDDRGMRTPSCLSRDFHLWFHLGLTCRTYSTMCFTECSALQQSILEAFRTEKLELGPSDADFEPYPARLAKFSNVSNWSPVAQVAFPLASELVFFLVSGGPHTIQTELSEKVVAIRRCSCWFAQTPRRLQFSWDQHQLRLVSCVFLRGV